MNPIVPAFAFPAEAGTHVPTPEGWKAVINCFQISIYPINEMNVAIDNEGLPFFPTAICCCMYV